MLNRNLKIHITPRFLVISAGLILLIPANWLFAWFTAATIHECFHCLALLLCRQKINRIIIDISGAQIQTAPLSNMQAVICAAAGPSGGLLLLSFHQLYPQLALCGLSQSLYNLLPIYSLDGGRILYNFTCMLLSERTAKRICEAVAALVMTTIFILSIIATVFLNTCLPVLIAMMLSFQQLRNKNTLQIQGSQGTIVLPK